MQIDDFEESNKRLWAQLPKKQIRKVFNDNKIVDIDPSFLGFVNIYEKLAQIIPQHFTVIDLGCAYNPQCFFFQKHRQYIAVDLGPHHRFQSKNCIIYERDIGDFIKENFVYYPYGGYKDLIRRTRNV